MLRYLVDTGVWVQPILNQYAGDESRRFLSAVRMTEMALTDFALRSVGVACVRRRLPLEYLNLAAVVEMGTLTQITLGPPDMLRIVAACRRHGLDFDDAYQFTAADDHDLQIVSLDKDFARTPRGYKTPRQVLEDLGLW